MAKKILLTDYAWADLEIERRTLAAAGCELIVAPAKDPASLAKAATDVDAIMTNWAKVTAEVIESAPRLRIVSRLGIGLDNIDVACCTRRKIAVTNVPDYCLIEVAEHALALLLSLARKVGFYHWQTKGRQIRPGGRPGACAHRRPNAGHRGTGQYRPRAGPQGPGAGPEGRGDQPIGARRSGRASSWSASMTCWPRAIMFRSTCR